VQASASRVQSDLLLQSELEVFTFPLPLGLLSVWLNHETWPLTLLCVSAFWHLSSRGETLQERSSNQGLTAVSKGVSVPEVW